MLRCCDRTGKSFLMSFQAAGLLAISSGMALSEWLMFFYVSICGHSRVWFVSATLTAEAILAPVGSVSSPRPDPSRPHSASHVSQSPLLSVPLSRWRDRDNYAPLTPPCFFFPKAVTVKDALTANCSPSVTIGPEVSKRDGTGPPLQGRMGRTALRSANDTRFPGTWLFPVKRIIRGN